VRQNAQNVLDFEGKILAAWRGRGLAHKGLAEAMIILAISN
jgi:hypothetical protein